MPVIVQCACGAKLRVPDSSAGKDIKCPRCARPVAVPAPAPPADASGRPCPSCGAANPGDAAACTKCGFDLSEPAPGPPPAAPDEGGKACPYCAEKISAAATVCPYCRETLGGRQPAAPQAPAERDLAMEAHLKAVALWNRIGGLLLVGIGLLALLVIPLAGGTRRGGDGSEIAGALIGAVVSLAIGAAYLWVYFNGRAAAVCSREYAERVARTPHLKPQTFRSPFFWIPLAAIGIVVVLAILAVMVAAVSAR